MVDVNGDGKADLIVGQRDDSGGGATAHTLYIHTFAASSGTGTYGWTASSTYGGTIPDFDVIGSSYIITTGVFGDINGDGLPDFVANAPGYVNAKTYFGMGAAWAATTTNIFAPPQTFPTTGPSATSSQLVDVNGDGLDDWVYSAASSTYVLLNNGTGWNSAPSTQWTIATSTAYPSGSTYTDRGILFVDINGDGLPDFVRSYQNLAGYGCPGEIADVQAVYLNTGNGWATSTAYTLPAYITYCQMGSGGEISHSEYANFNGNGQLDQDVLTNITQPWGGSVAISYTASTVGSSGGSFVNKELPVELLTVANTVTNDGHGNYATTSYSYSDGRFYLAQGV
jgi:hypothetical protein